MIRNIIVTDDGTEVSDKALEARTYRMTRIIAAKFCIESTTKVYLMLFIIRPEDLRTHSII